jgi:anti-anti-sigma factor
MMSARTEGDRVVVRVRGELDLDAGEALQRTLRQALARSVRGVDLDFGDVGFCDCATLNVLLALRERALHEHKTVALRAASPALTRLLELSGTGPLFADGDSQGTVLGRACGGTRDDAALENLRVEVVQLRRALQTRPTIDLARGILMASFGLSADDAWTVLVMTSQNTNTKLYHLARDLVDAIGGEGLDETVQQQLAAAVARVHPVREPPGPARLRTTPAAEETEPA